MNGSRDKPTTLTIVGVWNSNLHILLYLFLSCLNVITSLYVPYQSPTKGRQLTICIFCGHMNGRRDKSTIPHTLTIVIVWNSNLHILLYPSLSCLYETTFVAWSLTPQRSQRFCIFGRHMNGTRDKPIIHNTFNIVGVWHSSISLFLSLFFSNVLSLC